MLDKKLMIIGGAAGTTAAAGGTGAAIHFSLNGESSNEEFDSDEPKSSGEGTDGGQSEKVQQKQKGEETGPGRDIMTVYDWLKLENRLAEMKTNNKCTDYGWELEGDKCSVPKTMTKMAHLELKKIEKSNMTDCISNDGYWWDTESENKCKTRNIILRGKFEKSLNNWEPIEKGKVDEKINGDSEVLKILNSNGYWEFKKYKKDYAVIFKKEKIASGPKKDWNFPSYYNLSDGKTENMGNVCKLLDKVSKETEDEKGLYLYNESAGSFWDCKLGGFMFISY